MNQVQLITLDGCGLAIAGYPRFTYDALGGGGIGTVGPLDPEGRQPLCFEPSALQIPDLETRTTRVLGLALPPGLRIAIVPELLEGWFCSASGEVSLRFRARFRFSIGHLYRAADLLVETDLSTGPVISRRHRVSGRPPDPHGDALLVGVALVPPSGDGWVDRCLGLPDEALALLRCRFRNLAPTTPS
jgi:hypothetical protein